MNANQMNGLYPIIRRVRRPLVGPNGKPVDWSADAKPVDGARQEQAGDSEVKENEGDEKQKSEEAKQD